jgi:hypothetical protein
MHTMDTTDNTHQPPQENAMKNSNLVVVSLLVVAVLASNGAGATENPPHGLQQQLAQNMSAEERAALREQLGNRMRETSPAEQALMRDSAYDGRQRMENGEEARAERRGGRNEGYGRGRESRQGGMGGGRGR